MMRGASRQALLVFAKQPTPGEVKTRLTALLSPEDAARLYRAFLCDALRQYACLPVAVRLYMAGAPKPGDIPLCGASVHRQSEGALGERMQAAILESVAAGHERLVLIGTDHPTLPTGYIAQAFSALEHPPAVAIGSTEDGGFYLLGMHPFYPELFHHMQYSHGAVFADTLERARSLPARLSILPPWYDVDTPSDLIRLARALDGSGPLHTCRVMADLLQAYPALRP